MAKREKAAKTGKLLPYQNDFEYLEDHFRLLDLIGEQKRIQVREDSQQKLELEKIAEKISRQREIIRKRRDCSLRGCKSFSLEKMVSEYHLHSVERKILLFLLYRYFTPDGRATPGRVVLENITSNRLEMMRFRHYLMEYGRLRSNKLITCEDVGERSILDLEFNIPEEIISRLLGEKEKPQPGKKAGDKSYRDFLNLWFSLVGLLEEKAEFLGFLRREEVAESQWELNRIRYNIRKTEKCIEEFQKIQEGCPLEEVVREYELNRDEKLILLILLRDSLGLSDSFMGYEGKKLLAVISESENEVIAKRPLLYKKGRLRSNNLIRMEGHWSGENILEAEYFLHEKMIRRLLGHSQEEGIEELGDDKEEEDHTLLRIEPKFSFADVVLSEEKKKYIEIALSQQMNRDLIFNQWGFGKSIPYGNSLTMLFYGPSGTGKTMMAEAVAHYLKKKLLIANYAQIQNLYVGETEKRIVSTFRSAREQQGVLLWDEADSMFFSRSIARSSWESRDVNIMLQELEKFPEVVILTTNRKIALDSALERRITVKVEFEMPEAIEREAIWKRLIPHEAPIGDVDFKYLAETYPVSGGVIKNAILHAARYAAYRKSETITMEDFVRGVKMEMENGWQFRDKIGFTTSLKVDE